ncbi:MAG: glycosyltransferase, partial [Thermoanaerobaculia bacterium]
MKVSLIVVNYNSKEEALNLIKSAERVKVFKDFEIIVVDNSKEEEAFKNSNVKYLTENRNLGYGGGLNYGAEF